MKKIFFGLSCLIGLWNCVSATLVRIDRTFSGKPVSLIKVVLDEQHTLQVVRSQSGDDLKNLIDSVGGVAGVNGAYFCPSSYSGCGGKNTSDANLIIAGKVYFPYGMDLGVRGMFGVTSGGKVVFSLNNLGYVQGISRQFNVLGMAQIYYGIANFPVLALSGKDVLAESRNLLDAKMNAKSRKAFICVKSDMKTIVMGSVANVTMEEFSLFIIREFSCFHAINLDAGASLGMIYANKVVRKPARKIMDAIVVVKKN